MSAKTALLATVFATLGTTASAQLVTYYSYPSAYAERRVTYMAPGTMVAPAPTVVYRPVSPVVAPLPVETPAPVIYQQAPAPVHVTAGYAPVAPQVVTTYRPVAAPVFAAPPLPVTKYVPAPVTTVRYRPILGGTVTRTYVGYAPVTTYVTP